MGDIVSDADDLLRSQNNIPVQPRPEPNDGPSAHDLVIQDLHSGRMILGASDDSLEILYFKLASIYSQICRVLDRNPETEMLNRKNFGLAKYGTPLQPNNGRNQLSDALDETADALVYVRMEIEERNQERNND
ncbi:hypothetical protein SEA_JUMBO_43 [Gordonia phage Jumbo]|uniref:Uncharacterized protein n=1 Tax=Gordonia phage Jumbo TaxID=1887650 RepID=A0A1B3B0L0_9CAUD|nr:hypothetical protein BIZ69_gp043 [Gordonia phage Jumbo]AOE44553.1 hypothetical protein SEA_JUMBO_43 [Gordonia phage Jumbo]